MVESFFPQENKLKFRSLLASPKEGWYLTIAQFAFQLVSFSFNCSKTNEIVWGSPVTDHASTGRWRDYTSISRLNQRRLKSHSQSKWMDVKRNKEWQLGKDRERKSNFSSTDSMFPSGQSARGVWNMKKPWVLDSSARCSTYRKEGRKKITG